jgi:dTDP-L-rhamnose 4-epimerase
VRVLVTGGAGFIGSHVVDALVDRGHDVVSFDALVPAAHHGPPADRCPGADHVRADVRDIDAVRSAVRDVDAVSHQAAMVGLGVDLRDIADYADHNGVGTATLRKALHERGFRGPLALASSVVVYGEGRYVCDDHGTVRPGPRRVEDLEAGRFEPPCPACGAPLTAEAIEEGAPLDPRNVYAATKLHQEHLCASYAREHGSPVAALRYHNVYGPRMPRDTPYAGVASLFRSALERGEAPRVLEDGCQTRNFLHVTDVARANVLALEASYDGCLNVASEEPRTVGAMAQVLAAAFGTDAPRPQVVGGYRLGDVRHVFASPEKAWRELGFRTSVRFDDGMRAFATDPLRAPATGANTAIDHRRPDAPAPLARALDTDDR